MCPDQLPKGWKSDVLGEFAYIKGRIGWRGLKAEEYTDSGPYLIAGNHIVGNRVDWDKCQHINRYRYLESPEIILKDGDVILSKDGTIGRLALIDHLPGEATINSTMMLIRTTRSEILNCRFLYYYLQGERFQKLIIEKVSGSSIPHIFQADMKNLIVEYPPIEEQRKIAEVLTTVDDAIEQTEALIRKYQRIKQGLMQDLLDNPSWPTHKLGDPELFSLYTGGTPSTEISEYWGGSIPWLSSGEVHKKRIWDTEKKITELGYKKSNARYIPVHSTLIALAGQGKTRGTAAITEIEITTNQSIAAIMPNEAKIDPYFLFHSLDYQYLRLRAASAGAGRAGLNLQLLAQFEIKVPNLISEQRSIAEYFETLDNTMHENLILKGKLVQLKQGLMQDLLTGKVRVNALLEQ